MHCTTGPPEEPVTSRTATMHLLFQLLLLITDVTAYNTGGMTADEFNLMIYLDAFFFPRSESEEINIYEQLLF